MNAIPQLLLVKYLFQKGQDALGETGPYSAGLAVSLFQDATELMARTIAHQVDANVGRNTSFEALWDAIKAGKKNPEGKELPLKTKALAVNNARVGFKHYGNLPDAAHAARFGADTEQFLDISCKDFLGREFKDISLIDLIWHKEAAEHLRTAQKALSNNSSETVLQECALAFHYLGSPMGALLPRLDNTRFNLSGTAERHLAMLDAAVRGMEQNINGLRNFTMATSLGISLFDYIRFQLVTPRIAVSITGSFQIQWFGGRKAEPENAAFALRFVTDYGVAVEKVVAGLTEADRKLLFGKTLIPHTPPPATSPATAPQS